MIRTFLLMAGLALSGCAAAPRTGMVPIADLMLGDRESVLIRRSEIDNYACMNSQRYLECSGTPSRVKCTCAPR